MSAVAWRNVATFDPATTIPPTKAAIEPTVMN